VSVLWRLWRPGIAQRGGRPLRDIGVFRVNLMKLWRDAGSVEPRPRGGLPA